MKKHLDFLTELQIYCVEHGYIIIIGATVKELKRKKTGETEITIDCTIKPIGKEDD